MDGVIRTGVCFFCHDGKGGYLISLRSAQARDEQGTWDPGGGGLKFGEGVEDAVHREVREEYGAEVKHLQFLGYRDVHRKQNGVQTHWVVFDFRVEVDPARVTIGEPHKCDGLKWVTIDELDSFSEPLHSQFPTFLKQYRQHWT